MRLPSTAIEDAAPARRSPGCVREPGRGTVALRRLGCRGPAGSPASGPPGPPAGGPGDTQGEGRPRPLVLDLAGLLRRVSGGRCGPARREGCAGRAERRVLSSVLKRAHLDRVVPGGRVRCRELDGLLAVSAADDVDAGASRGLCDARRGALNGRVPAPEVSNEGSEFGGTFERGEGA